MPRHNITSRRKVRANQSEPQGKYLKHAEFMEQESLPERIARFFKSIEDAYKQPNQNQVSETRKQAHKQQTDDQIDTHNFVPSKVTSNDDYAAYRAKIDQYFEKLENICMQEQLQPLQQMTYTPTTYTPVIYTPAIHPSVIYTPSMCMRMPITYVPNNYYAYTLCSDYGYSHVSYNYGVYQGETDNNYHHTDHGYCNKYVVDV